MNLSNLISPISNENYLNETTSPDLWLEKSLNRADRSDPDFVPNYEEKEDLNLCIQATHISDDRVFLVYESKLRKLLHKCQTCGGFVEEIKEMKNDGTQVRFEMNCLNGCVSKWSTQPELKTVAGIIA